MSDMEQPFEGVAPLDGPVARAASAGESSPSWPGRVTRVVAAQMRFWREDRGLSAQQLSEKTKELGYQVPRSVIANLENNRRDTVTAAEILVLAAALDIPPVMLITAVGREETTEILPGVEYSTWKSRGWILGSLAPDYATYSDAQWQKARRAIVLYDIHRLLVREHQQIRYRIKQLTENNDAPTVSSRVRIRRSFIADMVQELAYSVDRIREHRNLIKKEGFLLPELPPGVATLVREVTVTGRHHLLDEPDAPVADEPDEDEPELLPPLLYNELLSHSQDTEEPPGMSEREED